MKEPLSKKRKEELKQLLRPFYGKRPEWLPIAVLPWDVWRVLNISEYRTAENGKIVAAKLLRQLHAAIKHLNDEGVALPQFSSKEWAKRLWTSRTLNSISEDPRLCRMFTKADFKTDQIKTVVEWMDTFANYPYRTALKYGPQTEVEAAYVIGLGESDGHLLKEYYKVGCENERLSRQQSERQMGMEYLELSIRYDEQVKINRQLPEVVEQIVADVRKRLKPNQGRPPVYNKKNDERIYSHFKREQAIDGNLTYAQFAEDTFSEYGLDEGDMRKLAGREKKRRAKRE